MGIFLNGGYWSLWAAARRGLRGLGLKGLGFRAFDNYSEPLNPKPESWNMGLG